MKKWFSFLLCGLLFTSSGMHAAVAKPPPEKDAKKPPQTKQVKEAKYIFEETVYIPLPQDGLKKWKLGLQKADEKKGSAVTRYFLESESASNWTQLINIQFKDTKLVKHGSAESAMQDEASKSQVVNQKVHFQNPHDVLYERAFPTGEHEIVRLIMTKKGLHRVAYVKKGPLTKEERVAWVQLLSKGMIGGKERT